MILIGGKYMLDGIIEVLVIKSFQRSLAKILIELPDKMVVLVKRSRLFPCQNINAQ
jgi:hypothetical protein